jgi:acyl carrier protein
MMSVNLEDRVIAIIEKNIEKPTKITRDTDLRNDLGLDSFAMIIIINALEDEFGVTIDENDFKSINNVVDIANGLKQRFPELKES